MMDTSAEPIHSPVPPQKQHRSVAEKRRIVEETLAEGASVARVARARGVNANQVFQWRKLYQAGRLGGTPGPIKLLPVTVETLSSAPLAMSAEGSSTPSPVGTIHIKWGQAQIRIEGNADPALLRMVLESLRG
jgi:transposase